GWRLAGRFRVMAESDNETGGGSKEQDIFLSIANMSRIIKRALPNREIMKRTRHVSFNSKTCDVTFPNRIVIGALKHH
ncbi:hypothetical protein RYX36_010803, partial [Vicia faba]